MELTGKTILTTRAASQTRELSAKLAALGARVIECPTIEIVPVNDWTAVDQAIDSMRQYQWLLLTSANAVDFFMKRVAARGTKWSGQIAVVGPSTARRLESHGMTATIVPAHFRAEGLLEALPQNLSGSRILFPRAEIAREILPEELRRRGAQVDIIPVYRTVRPGTVSRSIPEILSSESIDCIAFTSPTTVRHFAELVEGPFPEVLSNIRVAVIGPVTQDAAASYGFNVSIIAKDSTIGGLVVAIAESLK